MGQLRNKVPSVGTDTPSLFGDQRASECGIYISDHDHDIGVLRQQNVLKTLRKNHITIVAIHNHMEGDNPKAIFLHYWGAGRAENLAKGVKSALDAQVKK